MHKRRRFYHIVRLKAGKFYSDLHYLVIQEGRIYLINVSSILFFIFCILYGQAQNLSFKSYTSHEGLSQNSIYSITQSDDGFMWFGSQAGLNRFDGMNFKTFIPVIKQKSGINTDFSKMITALYPDKSNMLWVGTTNELLLYNQAKDIWYNPEDIYPGFKIIPLAWVSKISEDQSEKIWISTQKKGLFCYDKRKKSMIALPQKIIDESPNIKHCFYNQNLICTAKGNNIYLFNDTLNKIIDVNKLLHSRSNNVVDLEISENTIWFIVNNNEIYAYNLKSNDLQRFNNLTDKIEFQNDFISLYKVGNVMWVGTRASGLLRINIPQHTVSFAKANNSKNTIRKNFILSMYYSNDGNFWVGTSGGGVSKFEYNKTGIECYRMYDKHNSEKVFDNMIFSIYTEDESDFYMGTLYAGLLKFNINSKVFQYFTPSKDKKNSTFANNIYSIVKGDNNLLWMATWGGVLSFDKNKYTFKRYYDSKNENTTELSFIIKLRCSNKLLIGSSKGTPLLFDIDTKKFSKCYDPEGYLHTNILRIRYGIEKDNGQLYLGTENKGLIKYNYFTGHFEEFSALHKISGVSRHFIFSQDDLWIGTEDGLVLMNVSDGKIKKVFTKKNGLSDNVIYAVLLDCENNVWVSCNNGINKIEKDSYKITKFSLDDGLQDLEFNTAAALTLSNQNLVFGGINGFNIVNPKRIELDFSIPTPRITEIKVLNTNYSDTIPLPYIKDINLQYNQNFLTIGFQCPIYTNSEKISYRYYLSGVNTTWVNSGNRNYVNFTQLKPGRYTFYFQAINGNHLASKTNHINIIIKTPWFLNTWFLSFSGLFIFFGIYTVVSNRVKAIHAKKTLIQKKAEAEMQSLRLQMNPHFIFNSLNSINSFIIDQKTLPASDYLTKFSKLMRLILENSRQETISIDKELESVRLYLMMEALRFSNSFDYQIIIDDRICDYVINIPPLIIQPFLENAIWHGLLPKEGSRKLILELQIISYSLLISIIDNGIGRSKSNKLKSNQTSIQKSRGMEITKKRIYYHNPFNSVNIIDMYSSNGEATGTRVDILISFMNESNDVKHTKK